MLADIFSLSILIFLLFFYPRKEMNMEAAHGTVVVFLQNAAGAACWGPTQERVNELLQAATITPAN